MKTNKLEHIKETGFKVPKDYFENVEESVLSQIKLKALSSESGFKTPNDYFDKLEDNILSKVSDKETQKVISILSRRNLIYISSIAATILLLFNLSIFENESGWQNIDAITVENYIINENIGSYELVDLLVDEDRITENLIELELSDEALESYILENATIEDLIKN